MVLRDPPEVKQYAKRGDPPMDQWPGRVVTREDLMKAGGDPRDWFRYGHRLTRVERFASLFGERHFPLYAPIIEFWTDAEDEPPWSWLRSGIPFDLMGFDYDGLHEMWNGYRDGLSAMALLVKPPDVYYDGPDGLRVAWLESAAERIPQETLQRVPEGGIPLEDLAGALKGTRFEGAVKACSWVLAETGNFFLDHCFDDGSYDGFADPWEDDIIAEGTEE